MKQKSKQEKQFSTGTPKKSLQRGTKEGLKKMHKELAWSLEEMVAKTVITKPEKSIRPPHGSTSAENNSEELK